ncbi:MAG: VanZ family protein [Betaproteobacteria bacterium]|nr:VanZ family protein [Betaproteobacteria bacterium]
MRIAALALGWLYVAVIVWLSLTPSPPHVDIEGSDKLEHFLAYGVLMFWFGVLYRSARARIGWALFCVALGVALEFAQRATGYRSFELADMAADALGVLAGALAALSLPRAAGAAGKETP